MPIDFPNSPSNGQTFTSGTRTWTYDGSKWNLTSYGAQGPQGATGAQGATGSTGFVVCTSSTRPGSPTAGQNIYETDTGDHLVYYGATTGWRPPWHAPWGSLGQSSITSAVAATAVTNTGLTITTASLPANRILKWTVTGHRYFASVNDLGGVDIYSGATSGGSSVFTQHFLPFGGSTVYADGFSFHFVETTSSVAAIARRVVVYRAAGTSGNFTFFADATRPGYFSCEDIGPGTANPPAS